ncbi:MAG TPA: hypothetical protein VGT03_14950 [Candidatus Acidoferrales bacterium]|nr:hypothetical protein [Candidatus Acidoferrales bacterium]
MAPRSPLLLQFEPPGASFLGELSRMVKRKKKRKFQKGAETRRLARETVGTPPPARVIPDRRLKPAKHKKRLLEEELL